jgi:hypothetical protein
MSDENRNSKPTAQVQKISQHFPRHEACLISREASLDGMLSAAWVEYVEVQIQSTQRVPKDSFEKAGGSSDVTPLMPARIERG